ncbi:hypothetical protein AXF42_Ash008999 [Apostasia shenzhenica]|uniref:Uncharacterized protein n=1 Tax=Apostasia shenzhenica TaxID=1088818 RepID=A0A2I0AD93_9ASPA|nr:hypothetical protein AXF42_Ash008999 [Apostasia shenzhenica]
MEPTEPTFVPEWYKSNSSIETSSSHSNHLSGSSHSADDYNSGFSLRNRFPVNVGDPDAPRSLSFKDKSSLSSRRSASGNGTMGREKEISSRPYNSFGRNHRERDKDKDRDREKGLDLRERERPLSLDNGFSDYSDSLISNNSDKGFLRRSHTMLSGRHVDSWIKRPGHESSNGVSGGTIVSGITKSSFERDFPSLGSEEKHVGSDVARVSSPGLSSAIHNLPATSSTIIGGDCWTSALAEVPPLAGGNCQVVSSPLQNSPALTSSASITPTCLNMAETLAQAPARVRAEPQVPSDSQKIEELHRLQILKLRPVTPSVTKILGFNSADKSKVKGTRTAESSNFKTGLQSSSQIMSHTLLSAVRADAHKMPQAGNFKVLNRERNGLSPTGKDAPSSTNLSRVPTPPSGIPATIPPINVLISQKVKVDRRVGALTPGLYGEKKPISQAQNRNDFFNSLRKKTSASQQANANQELSLDASSSNLEKLDEHVDDDSTFGKEKDKLPPFSSLQSSFENGTTEVCDAIEEPGRLVPDEEEAAFLRSLGWEENAGEEALTREEIESFLSEVIIVCRVSLSSSFSNSIIHTISGQV